MRALTAAQIAGLAFVFVTGVCAAQVSSIPSTPSAPPPSANNSDVGEAAKGLGADALKLAEETARGVKRLEELQKNLDVTTANTVNAKKVVDELIALLRETASRLSPDGAYARALNSEENAVRDWASRAASNRNPEVRRLARVFKGNAEEISRIRREAEQTRTRFVGEIDKLEQRREVLDFGVAVAQIDQFIKDAREYLDVVNGIAGNTKGLSDKIGQQFPGIIPTQ